MRLQGVFASPGAFIVGLALVAAQLRGQVSALETTPSPAATPKPTTEAGAIVEPPEGGSAHFARALDLLFSSSDNPDDRKINDELREGAAANEPRATLLLALRISGGNGAGPDLDAARPLAAKSLEAVEGLAGQGDPDSQALLGLYLTSDLPDQPDLDQAILLGNKGCVSGSRLACLEVFYGALFTELPFDFGSAFRSFKEDCNRGSRLSCSVVSLAKSHGKGVPLDRDAAIRELRALCTDTSKPSMVCGNLLASLSWGKDPSAPLSPDILPLSRAGCSPGVAAYGCANMSVLYSEGVGGVLTDLSKAQAFAELACKAGNCFQLALMLGENMVQGSALGDKVQLFSRDCAKGFASSCLFLGFAYRDGDGIPEDQVRSFAVFRRACDLGDGQGCLNVGTAYFRGWGTQVDLKRALPYFSKYCGPDNPVACHQWAWFLANGLGGLQKDDKRAYELYTDACNHGNQLSCHQIAFHLDSGRGIRKDRKRAKEMWKSLCAGGLQNSCDILKTL